MATVTEVMVESVVEAVTDGSHDGARPNRLRRSPGASCCTSMNSAKLIERVTASTHRRSRVTSPDVPDRAWRFAEPHL